MKLVAVLGSPHPNGPSSTLAKEVIRGAKEAGWEISLYEIESMHVRGCQGCRACKQKGIDCVVADDLTPYWKDLLRAMPCWFLPPITPARSPAL